MAQFAFDIQAALFLANAQYAVVCERNRSNAHVELLTDDLPTRESRRTRRRRVGPERSNHRPNRSAIRADSPNSSSIKMIAAPAFCTNTNTPPDRPGRIFRQEQSRLQILTRKGPG
ncbi:hypothetical protein [Pseudofrankia inefficax]|uniref:hypothetical protein n=1 Tax=Pseudofrankia inefficax (strain DSM 45817 / CECT 9037 / DDB 130130 / EuI1c) TaxID=298654 RepID=UPI0012FD98A3|nr:hypothetical protein [Pseudofrankia inefficax]